MCNQASYLPDGLSCALEYRVAFFYSNFLVMAVMTNMECRSNEGHFVEIFVGGHKNGKFVLQHFFFRQFNIIYFCDLLKEVK